MALIDSNRCPHRADRAVAGRGRRDLAAMSCRHLCGAEFLCADCRGRPFDGGLASCCARWTWPLHSGASGRERPARAGDAKALAVLDLDQDGWPDFFVSRNNNATLAFHNRGVAGRRSLRVQLRGPAGNPTAVGARITVELADGASETSEVCAGSGCYSQSSAAGFFGYPDSNPPRTVRIRWPAGRLRITWCRPAPPISSCELKDRCLRAPCHRASRALTRASPAMIFLA